MENEIDYKKYLALLNKHKRLFAFTALAIMTAAVLLSFMLPKKYEAQSTFFVEQNILSDLINNGNNPRNNETQDAVKGLNYVFTSRSLIVKVINDLKLNLKKQSASQLEALIIGLQRRTNVRIIPNEGLITISFQDKSPIFARDYVNTLVNGFFEENLSSKKEESSGATSFLSNQVVSVKERLDKIETELSNLKAKYGPAIAMAREMDNGRLDELELRRTQLEATRDGLRNLNPAKTRLAALQRKLEELRVEYTDNYPEVIKVKADIEAAREEASRGSSKVSASPELTRVDAELSAVRAAEERLHGFNSRGNVDPTAKATYNSLIQERTSLRTTYDQLMARQNQAEMSKQMAVQDKSTSYRIIDPAVLPLFPKSPNRVMIILVGIFAGLAGGFVLLLAIDYLDKSVKTITELKSLGIKIMAVIPKISDPQLAEQELQSDRKLYLMAGSYFSLIVVILLLEFLLRF